MKKILLALILFTALESNAQSTCLRTMCLAAKAKVGDTVTIGADFTSSNLFSSISIIQKSGPVPSVVSNFFTSYGSNFEGFTTAKVTGLTTPGTYIYGITAVDKVGTIVPGVDSIIVTAPLPPRTVTSLSFALINSVWTTTITYNDGFIQILP